MSDKTGAQSIINVEATTSILVWAPTIYVEPALIGWHLRAAEVADIVD